MIFVTETNVEQTPVGTFSYSITFEADVAIKINDVLNPTREIGLKLLNINEDITVEELIEAFPEKFI